VAVPHDQIGSWDGKNWNMVFSGVQGAPGNTFPNPPYTTLNTSPVIAEKPYLYVDNAGGYNVFVPALRNNSSAPRGPTATRPAARCRQPVLHRQAGRHRLDDQRAAGRRQEPHRHGRASTTSTSR